jgi:hypothetical protein
MTLDTGDAVIIGLGHNGVVTTPMSRTHFGRCEGSNAALFRRCDRNRGAGHSRLLSRPDVGIRRGRDQASRRDSRRAPVVLALVASAVESHDSTLDGKKLVVCRARFAHSHVLADDASRAPRGSTSGLASSSISRTAGAPRLPWRHGVVEAKLSHRLVLRTLRVVVP